MWYVLCTLPDQKIKGIELLGISEEPLVEFNAPRIFILHLDSSAVKLGTPAYPAVIDVKQILLKLVLLKSGLCFAFIPEISIICTGQDLAEKNVLYC